MTTIRLGCSRAGTLFYEPDGLLLRSCLIPLGNSHDSHLLTFQLGYLGPGEITVHVALDEDSATRSSPSFTTALLRGIDADEEEEIGARHSRPPGVWLTYAVLPDSRVNCRYTVWGQPSAVGDDLRGELTTEVSGTLPMLTATTTAGITRRPLPDTIRSLPVMDWDQANGSGAGTGCTGRLPAVLAGCHQRAVRPIRNI
ncbi:hypothetical protein [Kitasatospora sp. SUK 42]|uniref:hypothetical protein n=1 Tax=Kitasatospora sp. SUK 42 TaxID=1588882 RepID=UPI001C313BD7|nr:hypothetical protein [Kitasatospora sp. SUK 42]MBV2156567.1 hypothetical protein [Kitasatospora sp. SUK 42]